MRIALYQPDQAGNVGSILRTAACLGVDVDVIEPCGFPFSPDRPERGLRRAAMDYSARTDVRRHSDWSSFRAVTRGRLVLLTTRAQLTLTDTRFAPDDVLLLGSESRGVPDAVHADSALAVRIPLVPGARSLNVAVAAGIALAEALRQTGRYPA